MSKQEFLSTLSGRLSGFPPTETAERLNFYSEMIDDKMEEGISEEEAVAGLGSVDDIISQIISEIPLTTFVKEKVKPKHTLRTWEIVLLVLGSPIWFSLLVAFFAIMIALYAILWSLVIALWAIELTLGIASIVTFISFFGLLFAGLTHGLSISFAMLGASFVLIGLTIFCFFGSIGAGKGIAILTKKIFIGIKSMFIKKEN